MDIFLARLPIFDQRRRVFAYELLFRSGPENYFGASARAMPGELLAGSVILGVPELTDGRPAFMTFSRQVLLDGFASVLSPEEVVIQLPGSLPADESILRACAGVKKAGFRVALDRPANDGAAAGLLEQADFVKVDPDRPGPRLPQRSGEGIALLAGGVDGWETFRAASRRGCRYFQGAFFRRPLTVSSKAIPASRLKYLRLVEGLGHPTTVDRLEGVVKQEASIAYRLLRRVNSVAFRFDTEVRSPRQALALLGEHEVRTSAMAWLLAEIGQEAPREVVVASTLRARTCELLASQGTAGADASEAFLLGLFSMLDAIVERPLEQVLRHLPVSTAIQHALLGQANAMRTLLDCVIAYEGGHWDVALELAAPAGIGPDVLASSYYQALVWTNEVFRMTEGART